MEVIGHDLRMIVNSSALSPRQLRSRAALHQALDRLTDICDIDAISISALAKEAGVGRPVFYRLYDDMSDLIIDRVSVDLEEQLKTVEAEWRELGTDPAVTHAATTFALAVVAARPRLYEALLNGSAKANAVTVFRVQAARLVALYPPAPDEIRHVPDALRIGTIAGATSGFLLAWIESGLQPPVEDAAPMLEALLRASLA